MGKPNFSTNFTPKIGSNRKSQIGESGDPNGLNKKKPTLMQHKDQLLRNPTRNRCRVNLQPYSESNILFSRTFYTHTPLQLWSKKKASYRVPLNSPCRSGPASRSGPAAPILKKEPTGSSGFLLPRNRAVWGGNEPSEALKRDWDRVHAPCKISLNSILLS